MRTFDIAKQFEDIKKAAIEAVNHIFPVEGKLRTTLLDKVWVEDKAAPDDYQDQAKVKRAEGTWGVPVYAALSLKDNSTGQIVDKMPKVKLFLLPKHTGRLSFIVGGNEYQVQNQLRLKPGAYTIRKQNGELKTQVNLAVGQNFDLNFDETKGVFKISKVGGGQANIPLYPVLDHLGMSHQAMSKAWGEAVAQANTKQDPKTLERAMAAFRTQDKSLKDYFATTKISPETTKLTLGQAFDKVDGPMLLAASKKLLDVHMGRVPPEDRDSLAYKELHGLEDFIQERIEKNKKDLARKIQRNLDNPRRTKLSQIVNPGLFNSTVESFFTQDDKSSPPEQTNPLEMISGQYRATIMGAGGIVSPHAITTDMRNIHPTHYGFIDPIHTPESDRIGTNLHIPLGARKDGKELKSIVRDLKAGTMTTLTAAQALDAKIMFPGQKGDMVKVNYRGQTLTVPRSEAQYETPNPQMLFSWSSNMIPYLPTDQGNRAMMAAKMLEQAISLKHREAPLVQVAAGDKTMEQLVGASSAIISPDKGVVKKVTADKIVIKTSEGDVTHNLYNNFSLNRKSFLNHEAKVKEGDRIKPGDLLADSNFTRGGVLALGANLKTAFIPYKGYNFEDGIAITQTAAEKLTSEHIYRKSVELDDQTILSMPAFKSQYPNAIQPDSLKKLDAEGVIKKGEKVRQGDAIIAVMRRRNPSAALGMFQKSLANRPKDDTLTWSLEDEGTVLDIQRSKTGVTVFIKTEEPAKIGDKLAGRHGNKGIITKIIPTQEAPRDKEGKPIDIMLNPHGVISRINIGQLYETAAGKVAKKTGQVQVVNNFSGENYLDTTKALLTKHDVQDKEELFDANGKSLGNVTVGYPHILKLFKQSTGNFSVRQGGPGQAYDVNQQPVKVGGEEGTKSLDLLTMYSLLSHGARANLREMSSLKSNQNDEFWKALKSGQQLPAPKTPFVYDKFMGYLKGAGINVVKNGTKQVLAPLTDKQVLKASSGEITKPVFYRAKDMEPVKDGFFDQLKTGGFRGDKWGHVTLEESIINPVFENAVRKVTGLGNKFDDIIGGKSHVDIDGKVNNVGKGLTGGPGIKRLLDKIDVKKEIKSISEKVKTAKGPTLDDMNKKLRYLRALDYHELEPSEAYMRKHVPVLPPIYRPIYALPSGDATSSDINFLYQNVGVLNSMMKLPVMSMLPDTEKADLRTDLYDSVKALSGLKGGHIIKGRPRDGFISEIKGGEGGQPKEGFFISKLLSKRQDFVGRGTIIPEPSLGIDELAMPEQMAWKMFEPFIIRELSKFGLRPNAAAEEIKNKTSIARRALDTVMKDRTVMLNRAPSLHKFSIMAFKPSITQGKAVKIPPLIVKGFNADFNGDSCAASTLVTLQYLPKNSSNRVEMCGTMEDMFKQITGKEVDEMIEDAKGFTAIYEIPLGRVRTLGLVNGSIKPVDIQRLTVHTSHGPCYRVGTNTGTQGIFSEHHNFSFIDDNLNMSCVKTEDMPTKVLIPKANLEVAWKDVTQFQSVEIGSKLLIVDKEMAYILGFYAGDGHVSDRRDCGKGFDGKKVPAFIFNSPREVRLYYIYGVLEAEGTICTDGFGNNLIRLEMNNDIFIRQLRILMNTCGIYSYLSETFDKEANHKAWKLGISKSSWDRLLEMPSAPKSNLVKLARSQRESGMKVSREVYDIVPFNEKTEEEVGKIGKKLKALNKDQKRALLLWRANNTGRKITYLDHLKNKADVHAKYVSRRIAYDLIHTYGCFAEAGGALEKWMSIVKNETILWEVVETVELAKREPVLFDFTVPEGETFCIDNGLITHNTMTVHMPITDEAVQESMKMLPSRNLYQPGTNKLIVSPSQESQLGIYYLSQTDAGRKRLNAILGSKFAISAPLNKGSTAALLANINKQDPKSFVKILQDLKTIGDTHAYDVGFTVGLSDLPSLGKQRDVILKNISSDLKGASVSRMAEINASTTKQVDDMLEHNLKGKGNAFYDMVHSGARGDKSQLRSILASPLFVSDAKGRTIHTAIGKSYSEGLDIGDYWVSLYGARRGMMDRSIQTQLPGAFSKSVMASTIDNVVSAIDCGTKNGIMLSPESEEVLDRYLAGPQGGFAHNTLIDSTVRSKLKSLKEIKVRSPLTCLQAKGTCAKCYGLDEHGEHPHVGDNIGAKAGQAISEPLMQMVMNCSVGNITSNGITGSFEDIYNDLAPEEEFDGVCHYKATDFNVLDAGSPAVASTIQHHMPDDDMLFIKTKTGHSMLVQANHPLWIYDKEGNGTEKLAGEVIKGERLLVDDNACAGYEDAPLNPYLIGLFLAEGSTRYGNGTKKYDGVAVASIITQSNNLIKDKAFECIKNVPGATNNKLDIQIYNPEYAALVASVVRGREAKLKRLVPGFNRWKNQDLLVLLAGWIDGDGSVFLKWGITVANVYTSSYVALQQLEIICHKLGVRFSPTVVPQQPLQKTVQFVAQLRFSPKHSELTKMSFKMGQHPFKYSSYKIKREQHEPIVYIKKLWKWDQPVWDIKTNTRGFTCGLVRNHNTFHTGGVAGTGMGATGIKRVDQLLKLPKIVTGSAVLAPASGRITRIEPGIGGGYDIYIGDKIAHSSQGIKLKVKQGDTVTIGDALSEGVIKPQDLVAYKGMRPAQNYVVSELHKAYKDQGVTVQRKIFETVVRSLSNTTIVKNKPRNTNIIPGDLMPYTVVEHHNANLEKELPTDEAIGYHTAIAYGSIPAGTEITATIAKSLKATGKDKIMVKLDAIEHEPVLKNIDTLPLLKKDWMGALGYRNLAKALTEGASQAWETDIHDYHPVPAFAYGAEFGKGEKGKY